MQPEPGEYQNWAQQAARRTDFVHAVIPGKPPPMPRGVAMMMPAGTQPQLLARAHAATKLRHLYGLFYTRVVSNVKGLDAWKKAAAAELLAARNLAGYQDYFSAGVEAIEVMILVVAPLPKSAERKTLAKQPKRIWLITRGGGDWDNYGKPVCDAATGILWDDDCQIARGSVETVRAAQGEESRLEILARPLWDSADETRFEQERRRLGL